MRIKACSALEKKGPDAAAAVPFLIRVIDDDHSDPAQGEEGVAVGGAATLAIKAIGEPAVQPTINALRGASSSKRLAIVYALGLFSDPRAVRALLSSLNDEWSYVSQQAARLVERRLEQNPNLAKAPGLLDSIADALNNEQPEIREYVVDALGHCRQPQALKALSKMLDDSDSNVRPQAIAAIGMIGGRRAEDLLLKAMRDGKRNPYERGKAAESLGQIDVPTVVTDLVGVLEDHSQIEELRAGAARGLGKTGDKRAARVLLSVMKDRSESISVRSDAMESFAGIKGRGSLGELTKIATTKNEKRNARWWAAYTLVNLTEGAIDNKRIVDAIKLDVYGHDDELAGINDRALRMLAKNGLTPSVRAAARGEFVLDEGLLYAGLCVVYYGGALGFWWFRYRRFIRVRQFTLGSIFLLTTLTAIGLPLVIAAWNTW